MRRARLFVWLALLLLLGVWLVPRLEVRTDVTNLMPAGTESRLAAISRKLSESELARTMVLTIGAADRELAVEAARELEHALRARPEIAWIRGGADEGELRALYELYFPRRFYFVADGPEALAARLSDAGLAARAAALRRELAGPTSALASRVAPADPLGVFGALVERAGRSEAELDLLDGRFVTRDGRFAVLFLGTRASAFDGAAQRAFLVELQRAFDGLAAHGRGELRLESSGANRFAVSTEDGIRGDVHGIALLGMAGVALLVIFGFGSPRAILLTFVPVVSGIVVAVAAGGLVFGRLDGITLGFGASLVGVVVDYPIHLLVHAMHAPYDDVGAVLGRVRRSLALGGLTTMASFAGLGLTSFPGFREIAFFSLVGVAVALLVTLLVLPAWAPRGRALPRASQALQRRLGAAAERGIRARGPLWIAAGLCLLLAIPAATRLAFVDDLSRLFEIDPALRAEDERVRARVSRFDAGRFVIALAPDRETALARNDAVHGRLEAAIARGDLERMRSLHDLLWARALQEQSRDALRADATLADRIDRAFGAAGFRAGAFEAFARDLASPPPPLSFDDLAASPLADLVRPLLVELGDETAVVTWLRGVRDPEALRATLADLPDVHLFDQRAFLNEIYARFRTTTIEQVFVGNGLVLVLLWLRYRSVRTSLAAWLPSMLVASAILGAHALLGAPVNLLHAVSLVMVTGMGVDYAIFVIDAARQREPLGPTMLSLLLCCATTIFTFGVLATSRHPALQALGTTLGAGVLLSFVLAPVALLVDRAPLAAETGAAQEPGAAQGERAASAADDDV